MKTYRITFPLFFFLGLLAACAPAGRSPESEGKLQIVCTTGMIADAARILAGEHATVLALMGPGVDPHLYKATQGDLQRLTGADLVFYNGLHLEGKMGEVLEKLARQKPVVAVADGIAADRLLNSAAFAGTHDPHIWFDVELWSGAVAHVGATLQEQDPAHAEAYRRNTEAYLQQLQALHEEVAAQVATIPEGQRVMITAHDAFEYFGRAYRIEVRGLQGISTVSEYGLKDVADLVDFITRRRIKAVFVESSVPARSLEAVVEGCAGKGHQVVIGGTLFSDAMGAEGTPEGTYVGMVRHNVRTIVEALR